MKPVIDQAIQNIVGLARIVTKTGAGINHADQPVQARLCGKATDKQRIQRVIDDDPDSGKP